VFGDGDHTPTGSSPVSPSDDANLALRAMASDLSRNDEHVRRLISASKDRAPRGLRMTRVHGSLDLAHVLIYEGDFSIIGPGGDTSRPPEFRLQPQHPLWDVAVMIRSFQIAADVALEGHVRTPPHQRTELRAWARCWTAWSAASFMRGYWQQAKQGAWLPADTAAAEPLLRLLLLVQAFEAIGASLSARPVWLRLMIHAASDLLGGPAERASGDTMEG
jgi:maltose alpha-D-glucosyltransferase/alpha-amylase